MLLILSLLLGCSDHMVAKVAPRQPDILVYPEHINFGHLVSGQEKGEETFTIINTGDGDLKIFSPVLVSGNRRYNVISEEDEYTIPGGELMDFVVEYEPETFESNGKSLPAWGKKRRSTVSSSLFLARGLPTRPHSLKMLAVGPKRQNSSQIDSELTSK